MTTFTRRGAEANQSFCSDVDGCPNPVTVLAQRLCAARSTVAIVTGDSSIKPVQSRHTCGGTVMNRASLGLRVLTQRVQVSRSVLDKQASDPERQRRHGTQEHLGMLTRTGSSIGDGFGRVSIVFSCFQVDLFTKSSPKRFQPSSTNFRFFFILQGDSATTISGKNVGVSREKAGHCTFLSPYHPK